MPRIYTSQNDPLDFCLRHMPWTEEEAFAEYGNLGDGPDGRGNCFAYNADHPLYEYEVYGCEICHRCLTEDDNSYNFRSTS